LLKIAKKLILPEAFIRSRSIESSKNEHLIEKWCGRIGFISIGAFYLEIWLFR